MAGRHQYRVCWQREDGPLKRRQYETRKGAENFVATLHGDPAAATGRNPDAFLCCNSNPCICEYRGGHGTNRDEWAKRHAEYPPFVIEPYIESRVVGEWTSPQKGTPNE